MPKKCTSHEEKKINSKTIAIDPSPYIYLTHNHFIKRSHVAPDSPRRSTHRAACATTFSTCLSFSNPRYVYTCIFTWRCAWLSDLRPALFYLAGRALWFTCAPARARAVDRIISPDAAHALHHTTWYLRIHNNYTAGARGRRDEIAFLSHPLSISDVCVGGAARLQSVVWALRLSRGMQQSIGGSRGGLFAVYRRRDGICVFGSLSRIIHCDRLFGTYSSMYMWRFESRFRVFERMSKLILNFKCTCFGVTDRVVSVYIRWYY